MNSSKNRFTKLILISSTLLLVFSCTKFNSRETFENKSRVPNNISKVKNVILMIGDGMGPQQVSVADLYARYAPHSVVKNRQLAITSLFKQGHTGFVFQRPHNGLVIDSACSATQMATGVPSASEMIGLNYKGKSVPTILELATTAGLSTGIVSDTRIYPCHAGQFYKSRGPSDARERYCHSDA